jgi:hypothetical protein
MRLRNPPLGACVALGLTFWTAAQAEPYFSYTDPYTGRPKTVDCAIGVGMRQMPDGKLVPTWYLMMATDPAVGVRLQRQGDDSLAMHLAVQHHADDPPLGHGHPGCEVVDARIEALAQYRKGRGPEPVPLTDEEKELGRSCPPTIVDTGCRALLVGPQ